MGRLYQKTTSGQKVLAHFENGQVRCDSHIGDPDVCYNSIGQIFFNVAERKTHIIATCDQAGNIYKGGGGVGSLLARCEDGKIYEGSSRQNRVLAWYDGDMYGAAAAVVIVFVLCRQ